ncbi:hypothetical protein TMRO357_02895 [Alteriqipengyuania sp. 357]
MIAVVLVGTLLLIPGAAIAQASDGRSFEAMLSGFDQRAERARALLRDREESQSLVYQRELADMRSTLAADRDRAAELVARGTFQTRLLDAQIDALGAPPADGETEPSPIADRRSALEDRQAGAMQPLLDLQERRARAALLVAELDARSERIVSDQRYERGLSPLDPRIWGRSVREFRSGLKTLRTRNGVVENPLSFLLLGFGSIAVLGAISIWIGHRIWHALAARVTRRLTQSGSVLRHLLLLVVLDLVAALVFLIGLAISVSMFIVTLVAVIDADHVTFVALAIGLALGIIVLGSWLGRSVFASPIRELRLLALPEEKETKAAALVRLLAVVVAAELLIASLEEQAMIGINIAQLLSFALVLAGAALTWRMAALLVDARRAAKEQQSVAPDHSAVLNFSGTIARIMKVFAIASLAAALVGYAYLARYILIATLASLAIVCLAVYVHRFIGLIVTTLAAAPLHQYRRLLHLAPLLVGFVLTLLALPILAITWGYNANAIGDGVMMLRNGIEFGDVRLSAGDVITFLVVFFLGYFLTRWIQRFTRIAIIPEFGMDTGAQAAIITFLGYVGITLAAFIAIAATGLDLSSLAFVAGALSVGLGFGLQSVVENFVSGILLLIERPVKVGDWVEVGEHSGIVRRIAVRSTHIETFDRHQIIVPNSQLITEVVKNRSFSVGPSRIIVPVGVAYGTDLEKARNILLEIANADEKTLDYPEPQVAMDGFGDSAINLKILAFVPHATDGAPTASALNFEIARRFEEEGISIPFPQRDLHLKSLPASYGAQPSSGGEG